ncbi:MULTISPECIES: DUF1471 domain-containing protein [Enterobacteriaceae]|uniref:DUF1471 domain-containing protein n=1 Tax=Raoultella lignicola TaxID=3040939 RepID=A0ABU9FCV4_9ENTR|nr:MULTISPECIES: DUF1471 domain-containing protein [Enterobacteriaceae]MRT48055.1 DUF1471 domain-containing protein [Raoultella sp. RIT712]QNK05868.1 DUF1471 domain-containing protein [Enterobacter sp. JUb54]ROS13392.1 multiple stress resistance protein BhsA [Raoultella sp. BIGb0399]
MKAILISAVLISSGLFNVANAAQLVNDAAGKEKIGVVSASNALTLDELSDALSQKADKQGASEYKILSATGNNRLHGVAEIYK